MDDEKTGKTILDCAFRVHTGLGPGLLESVYETCLAYELSKAGLDVKRQVALPVNYDGVEIDAGFRLDLLVDGCVVVELKTVDMLRPVHQAQILSYLRLGGYRLGYILNFNVNSFRHGIKRFVN